MSAAPSMLRMAPRIARALPASSSRAVYAAYRASSTLPARAEHVATPIIRAAPSIPPMAGAKPSVSASSPSPSPAPAAATAAAGDKAPAPRRRQIKSKKAALTMTPEAVTRLRALSSNPTEPKLLRIGVKTRGCAGMAYHLDYVNPPGGKFDEVVEQDGVKVLIDSKALFSIIGSTMDWRDNRLSAGFVFDNPNIVDTCGCGESFNIKF